MRNPEAWDALLGGIVIRAVQDAVCTGKHNDTCSTNHCGRCRRAALAFLESPRGQELIDHMGTNWDYVRKGIALTKEKA